MQNYKHFKEEIIMAKFKQTNSLEIIEEEAEVIRYSYKLYLEGYGIRRIINELCNDSNNMFTRNKKPLCYIRRVNISF